MSKKNATDAEVMAFIQAVFPDAPALARVAFDEAHVLRTATALIHELRAKVASPVVPVGALCGICGVELGEWHDAEWCDIVKERKAVVPVVASPVEQDYKSLYFELLYQVSIKHPGESRHQTALRYIRERETPSNIAYAKSAVEPT